jgi:hypothetical protein
MLHSTYNRDACIGRGQGPRRRVAAAGSHWQTRTVARKPRSRVTVGRVGGRHGWAVAPAAGRTQARSLQKSQLSRMTPDRL